MTPSNQKQMFPHRQRRKESILIEHGRDLPPKHHSIKHHRQTVNAHITAQRVLAPRQRPDDSGLAGTIETHHRKNLTASEPEGHLPANGSPHIPDQQTISLKHFPHGVHPSTLKGDHQTPPPTMAKVIRTGPEAMNKGKCTPVCG